MAALAGWRLRPGTAATPLTDGVHLRGHRSQVTFEGSRALPALWRLLEAALRSGDLGALRERAPAGSPAARAVATLVSQLHAHDLLVRHEQPAPPPWRTRLTVGDPAAPLARRLAAALTAEGIPLTGTSTDPALAPGDALLEAEDPGTARRVAVGALTVAGTTAVTEPAPPAQARRSMEHLAARLKAAAAPDEIPEGAPGTGSERPAAMAAGTAVHRLLCAVTGGTDPAAEGEDPRLLAGVPAVLLVTDDPPRAEYRPWAAGARASAAPAPPRDLAEALQRVGVLTDPRLGVLDAPLPGSLPQLPVALVSCGTPAGTLLAGGLRTDLARLDALCRAAELALGGDCAVGAGPEHAAGRALRRAALAVLGAAPAGEEIPPGRWSAHPQVAYWWRTLTVRLGVAARLTVHRPDPRHPVFHATVTRSGSARVLGEAVEPTASAAAAFAALAATLRTTATTLAAAQPAFPAAGPGAGTPATL
ncbi:hypothetical protein, partial [Streptomyces sp. WAC06614]|uniref:hypothetical protein n=1 Tax=Streptomyces sp. WAC06614 TaxID=2487416 RepID=UPI000F7A9226